ncbi:MAG: hypothetical protein QXJ59_01655 [Thermofilaceae archaeon]
MPADEMMMLPESCDKRQLLLESLRKGRLLLGPDSFNSVADYLLLKKYVRYVNKIKERDGYIVAKVLKRRKNHGDANFIVKYLFIGVSENDKFVVFLSDRDFHSVPVNFGFDLDVSRFSYFDVSGVERDDVFLRVQGDIILRVAKVDDPDVAFISSLYEDSYNIASSVLHFETLRRVADVLSELAISPSVYTSEVVVEGCPKKFNVGKLVSHITTSLVLSDIFPQYETKVCEDAFSPGVKNRIVFYNDYNTFVLDINAYVQKRRSYELSVRAYYHSVYESKVPPEREFFYHLVEESGLLEQVAEETVTESYGRHRITFGNAYPRGLTVEYVFPLSGRRYSIAMYTNWYVTSGTEITVKHPEHGEKTVKVPASRVSVYHVTSPDRTTVEKNALLLRHYFP